MRRRLVLLMGLWAVVFGVIGGVPSRSTPVRAAASSGTLLFESRKGETWEVPGRLQLGLVDTNGTNAMIVRDLGPGVEYAELSPDQRFIGLTDDADRLFVLNLKTDKRATIAHEVHSWAWAPDSRRIAYSSGTSEGHTRQIFIVGVDGSRRHQITHNTRRTSWKYFFPYNLLAWSPNGRWIAFANWQNYSGHGPLTGGRLFTISPRGGREQQVTKFAKFGSGWAFVPYTISWAPNSRELAVASQATAGVLVVRGSKASWLPGSDCCVAPNYLAWSPDGTRIAFLGADTSTSDSGGIAAVNGAIATTIAGSENGFTADPFWSPRGDHLAFLECRYDDSYDGRRGCTLIMSDRDGRHRVHIQSTVKIDGLLGWSR